MAIETKWGNFYEYRWRPGTSPGEYKVFGKGNDEDTDEYFLIVHIESLETRISVEGFKTALSEHEDAKEEAERTFGKYG